MHSVELIGPTTCDGDACDAQVTQRGDGRFSLRFRSDAGLSSRLLLQIEHAFAPEL